MRMNAIALLYYYRIYIYIYILYDRTSMYEQQRFKLNWDSQYYTNTNANEIVFHIM